MDINIYEGNALTRLYTHLNDGNTFAIIGSLDKDGLDKSHYNELRELTIDNYKWLDSQERANRRISYRFITGTYTMEDSGKTITEKTLLIYNIPKEEAIRIGKKINQESIIWKDKDFFGFIYMDGREENCFNREMLFDNDSLQNFSSRLVSKHNEGHLPFAFKMTETRSPGGHNWEMWGPKGKEIYEETIFEYSNEFSSFGDIDD